MDGEALEPYLKRWKRDIDAAAAAAARAAAPTRAHCAYPLMVAMMMMVCAPARLLLLSSPLRCLSALLPLHLSAARARTARIL